MTWKECKDAVLYKMYSSRGGVIDYNESGNKDYIAAMIHTANEGIERIVSLAGRPLRKTATFEADGVTIMYTLRDICPRYRGGDDTEVYSVTGNGVSVLTDAVVAGNAYLILPAGTTGTVMVKYTAQPKRITADTDDEDKIDLPNDQAVLLPLYMAGELFKEDDNQIATIYMNEFEAKLGTLSAEPAGVFGGDWQNTKGWY